MRMVRQTAALICCHAAARGVVIGPALAAEIALDVHVDIEVPLGHQCVNTDVLNVRAGPSKDTELLFQIQEGQRVEVWGRFDTSNEDTWCFVMWDEGEGWVSDDYLADCPSVTGLAPSVLENWDGPLSDRAALQAMTSQPPPEFSSEAFHEALEVDTEGAKLTIYDLSTMRGRLRSLAYRYRWWRKKRRTR